MDRHKAFSVIENAVKEHGYVYHATTLENVEGIVNAGALIPHKPNYGTDQDAWPDGSTHKRSYFIDDPKHAVSFVPEHGTPALLRVPETGMKRESTGDRFTNHPITADKIQILNSEGQWHNLQPRVPAGSPTGGQWTKVK